MTVKKISSNSIDTNTISGVPIMLTQAIIIAFALCFGELLCSPLYVSFAPEVFPIFSWGAVAVLLSVMFSYIVGFALLWCAESFAYRMQEKVQPLVYSTIGAIGFGVWTCWVVLGVMNAITGPLGYGTVSQSNTVIAVINGALLGLASFFLAATVAKKISQYRIAVIVLAVITLILAAIGGYILFSMMQVVAHH